MINIISPINQLGYGVASLNIVKYTSKITDVAFWPIGQIQVTNQEDFDSIQYCIENSKKPDFNAPCIRIWHQNDMSQFVGRGKKIGFPIFELDKFNDIEKHHLSSLDKIFVCSDWAKQVILENIEIASENVCVVPLGVDSSIFKSQSTYSSRDKTIFFNCGKWEIRKGHDVLVEVFNKAFEKSDNVELWMMCENPFLSKEEDAHWKSLYLNSKLGEKIKILPRLATQNDVYNIMKNTHCGIFPSRAEGWNLELLEMLSCGKHVITTNYSAHTEFCNKDNAHLLEINQKENAYDGKWFYGQGNWAKIGQEEKNNLIDIIKSFHLKNINGEIGLNNNGILTAAKYSWENTARKIIQHAI